MDLGLIERHAKDICLKLPVVSPQKTQRTGVRNVSDVVYNYVRQSSAATTDLLYSNNFLLVQCVQLSKGVALSV